MVHRVLRNGKESMYLDVGMPVSAYLILGFSPTQK